MRRREAARNDGGNEGKWSRAELAVALMDCVAAERLAMTEGGGTARNDGDDRSGCPRRRMGAAGDDGDGSGWPGREMGAAGNETGKRFGWRRRGR